MSHRQIYLDTSVFKFSSTRLPRFRPRKQTINWGGRNHEITVNDLVYLNPNDSSDNAELKAEADLLSGLAKLGKQGRVKYVFQAETLFESWGLQKIMGNETGIFYNAPCEMVDAPIKYGRQLFSLGSMVNDWKEMQFDFLSSINHKRFLELQKMTGAYQGQGKKPRRNPLLDAFHIWCAEHNKCDYFLTLDFKLINMSRKGNPAYRPLVEVVKPSELVDKLNIKA